MMLVSPDLLDDRNRKSGGFSLMAVWEKVKNTLGVRMLPETKIVSREGWHPSNYAPLSKKLILIDFLERGL